MAINDDAGVAEAIHGKTLNDSYKERTLREAGGETEAEQPQSTTEDNEGRERDNENNKDKNLEAEIDNRETPTHQIAVNERRLGVYPLARTTVNRPTHTAIGEVEFDRRTDKERVSASRGRPRKTWNAMGGTGNEQRSYVNQRQRSDNPNWRDKQLSDNRHNRQGTYRGYRWPNMNKWFSSKIEKNELQAGSQWVNR